MALSATIMNVSSNYGNGANDTAWGAASALDGNPATAWSSNSDGSDAYLVLDFGAKKNIGAIDIWTRTMSDGTAQISIFSGHRRQRQNVWTFHIARCKKIIPL